MQSLNAAADKWLVEADKYEIRLSNVPFNLCDMHAGNAVLVGVAGIYDRIFPDASSCSVNRSLTLKIR